MRYFIEDAVIYRNRSLKWDELKEFIASLRQQLVADKQTLEKIKSIINEHLFLLNRSLPRIKPLTLYECGGLTDVRWNIYMDNCGNGALAIIHIREVRGDIHISLQNRETVEFSPDTDEESSANRVGIPPLPTR